MKLPPMMKKVGQPDPSPTTVILLPKDNACLLPRPPARWPTLPRALALVFSALGAAPLELVPCTYGLPPASAELASINLVVSATVCDAPMFRAEMSKVASNRGRDVLLTRVGLFPEVLNPVTSEVALVVAGQEVLLVTDLAFYMHRDHGLWLVSENYGPFIQVSDAGLGLSTEPPFITYDEKIDGLCRAAREVVRITTRGRVR